MDVSLEALSTRVLRLRSWDEASTSHKKRVYEAINIALERLAGEVPEALVPDLQHVELIPDSTSGGTSTRMAATADSRVLSFTTTAGAVLGASPAWAPTIDGTWDGLLHLEIKDPDGTWRRRQSMEWWNDADTGAWYVSVDRPWRNATDTLMEFRIHQPQIWLDAETTKLRDARIWNDNRTRLGKVSLGTAHRMALTDVRGQSTGPPTELYPGHHYQVPAPQNALVARADEATKWQGPEYNGSFRFCYTYVRGRRTQEHQSSPGGTLDPMWESAPSPEVTYVATIHNSGIMLPTDAGNSIQLRATNIDALLDFDVTGSLREGRSGHRIRFYVARDAVEPTTPGGQYDNTETAGIFYLLAEVDPATTIPTAVYTWTGAQIPDHRRRLQHSTGYFGWRPWPHHDARYVLDLEVERMPRTLAGPRDTAPIKRNAVAVLLEITLYYLSLQDGNDQESAQLHLRRYEALSRQYRRRYANQGGQVLPRTITPFERPLRLGTFSGS